MDGFHVRSNEMLLLRKRFLQQACDDVEVDIGESGDNTDVRDILHQDSRTHAVESLVAQA